jgi:hypothetical protein
MMQAQFANRESIARRGLRCGLLTVSRKLRSSFALKGSLEHGQTLDVGRVRLRYVNGAKLAKMIPLVLKITVRVLARPSHRRRECCAFRPSWLLWQRKENGITGNSAKVAGKSEMIHESNDGTGGDRRGS